MNIHRRLIATFTLLSLMSGKPRNFNDTSAEVKADPNSEKVLFDVNDV